MNPLPASVRRPRGVGGCPFTCLTLAGIFFLSSCTTTTKVADDGDKITSGFGQRTTIVRTPDGTITVTTTPINWLEALAGGVTRGTLGWLSSEKHKEATE